MKNYLVNHFDKKANNWYDKLQSRNPPLGKVEGQRNFTMATFLDSEAPLGSPFLTRVYNRFIFMYMTRERCGGVAANIHFRNVSAMLNGGWITLAGSRNLGKVSPTSAAAALLNGKPISLA